MAVMDVDDIDDDTSDSDFSSVASSGGEEVLRDVEEEQSEASDEEDERKDGDGDAGAPAAGGGAAARRVRARDPDLWQEPPRDVLGPEAGNGVNGPGWDTRLKGAAARNGSPTALYLFRQFFSDALLTYICKCTNEEGARRFRTKWTNLDIPELLDWLALKVAMGMHQLPSVRHYWSRRRFGMAVDTRVPHILCTVLMACRSAAV